VIRNCTKREERAGILRKRSVCHHMVDQLHGSILQFRNRAKMRAQSTAQLLQRLISSHEKCRFLNSSMFGHYITMNIIFIFLAVR
jgi:hypothetical protein